jgi:hypothetical protein
MMKIDKKMISTKTPKSSSLTLPPWTPIPYNEPHPKPPAEPPPNSKRPLISQDLTAPHADDLNNQPSPPQHKPRKDHRECRDWNGIAPPYQSNRHQDKRKHKVVNCSPRSSTKAWLTPEQKNSRRPNSTQQVSLPLDPHIHSLDAAVVRWENYRNRHAEKQTPEKQTQTAKYSIWTMVSSEDPSICNATHQIKRKY